MINYKHLSNTELEALLAEHMNILYEIRQELDRRKNQALPKTNIDFTNYITK